MSCVYHRGGARPRSCRRVKLQLRLHTMFSGFYIHPHLKRWLLASPAHLLFITALFLGLLGDIRLSQVQLRSSHAHAPSVSGPGHSEESSRKQSSGRRVCDQPEICLGRTCSRRVLGEQRHLNTCGLRLRQVRSLIYSPPFSCNPSCLICIDSCLNGNN